MDQTVLTTCPVCYEIIKEPVRYPCQHELCLLCFNKSLETANHWCPICRRRISSWARKNAKNPVNTRRKREIEKMLESSDAEIVKHEEHVRRTLCEPGEVRKEYLCELHKLNAQKEQEEKAGEILARSIQQEEKIEKIDNFDEEFDLQMAEVMSQEYILKQISTQKQQLDEDLKLAKRLSGDCSCIDQVPRKKIKLENKPITNWFHSSQ